MAVTGTVQDWINNLLDFGLGDDMLPDDLIAIINSVIVDVNSRQAWPFADTSVSNITLTQGTAQVTLPARFNKSRSFVIDSLSQVLVPERRDTLVKRYVGSLTQQGVPQYYYFIGQQMFVYPTPATTYNNCILDYTQDEVVVTAATTLSSLLMPIKHQDVYFLGTLAKLYAMEDDTEMFGVYNSLYEQKIVNMMDDLVMHDFDMPNHMIDVWDDGDGGWW